MAVRNITSGKTLPYRTTRQSLRDMDMEYGQFLRKGFQVTNPITDEAWLPAKRNMSQCPTLALRVGWNCPLLLCLAELRGKWCSK
jgi:ferredoxin